MKTEIGAYEAKTRLPELLRAVKAGKRFTITNRGQAIADLVMVHLPTFDPASIELRSSSKGTYLSLTLLLRVDNRTQLEAVYRAVAAHPWVRVVL